MKRPSLRTIFWMILLLALTLRLAAAVVVDRHVKTEGRQFLIEGDANGYWELAQKLAKGEDYSIYQPARRILRMPGFPILLAVSIRIFGPSILAASVVMACSGTGCCWLTHRLARSITNETTALIAMFLVAVSPLQIGNSVQILSETWFTFWLLICLLALKPLLQPNSDANQKKTSSGWTRALLCGLLTGVTTLVRPGWILWAGFSSMLILVFGTGAMWQRLARCVLIGIGTIVALLPWAWRNHEVSGHWVFTSLWSGPSLYDGLHPGATGASDMRFVDEENVFASMSEFDANAHYKQRALQFVLENPRRTLELSVLKAGRFLSPTLNATGFSGGPFSLICLAWYAAFAFFTIVGCLRGVGRLGFVMLLTSPFVQFLLVHMVFVGSIRYRLPVEYPLSILVAAGLQTLVTRRVQIQSSD